MKRLLIWLLSLSCVTTLSLSASAQMDDHTAKGNTHNGFAMGSFTRAGFAFGLAYEYMFDASAGVGAHLRSFQKDRDEGVNGYMVVGAAYVSHFYKRSWDLSFAPSFNIINVDSYRDRPDDATTMGPGLTISLLYQVAERVAIGFDNSRYWVWFDDDYAGLIIDDLAFKLRVNF
ncbi:MAG: hypothetical protein AB7G93_14980 [Bdellovibrionales bacterium]